jgi:hypothetical protein
METSCLEAFVAVRGRPAGDGEGAGNRAAMRTAGGVGRRQRAHSLACVSRSI